MVSAQELLDKDYPKKNRKDIKELDISNKNLEGELNLEGFDKFQEFDCSNEFDI
ncbi:MAG: hypothetical protein MRERC_16c002 [Mycoplasmataceae bacterium RC_NB112A]|nr:MAG: hypothetical protein MRERC_16c002 [Mycoplasmataceae bacterium RC_NB112A]